MKRALPVLVCVLLAWLAPAASVRAQDGAAAPAENTPAPVAETPAAEPVEPPPSTEPDPPPPEERAAEPAATERVVEEAAEEASGDGTGRVVGKRKPAEVVRTPVKKKAAASVKRDRDGKVVFPPAPRVMKDVVRPDVDLDGADRARITGTQAALAAALGMGATTACAVLVTPPLFCSAVLFVTPFLAPPVAGAALLLWGPVHTLATSVGLFLPAWFHENDPFPLLAGMLAVAAVDITAWLLGGVVAGAILLRWANAPQDTFLTVRGPAPLPPLFPEAKGTDIALVGTFLVVMAAASFVGPLLGVAAYTAVNIARGATHAGARAEEPETPSPAARPGEAPAKAPRRRIQRKPGGGL